MATKTKVSKFFEENVQLINSRDPIAHNTNAGLLAFVQFVSSEFVKLNRRIDQLETQIRSKR